MKLLGLDFETTWTEPVDVKQARITEIGAVLYDWDTRQPLEVYSKLIWDSEYPVSPPELIELTGITDEMLNSRGISPKEGLEVLSKLMSEADHVVAHNGTLFDKPLYFNECARHAVDPQPKPWIDTRTDIPFPKKIKQRSLSALAGDHDFVNPFKHRAVFDVLTMMKVLGYYGIDEVIELSKQPLVHAIAKVSFQDKDKAKTRGYYWDGEKKIWFKPMKESLFAQEEAEAPFVVQKVIPTEGL